MKKALVCFWDDAFASENHPLSKRNILDTSTVVDKSLNQDGDRKSSFCRGTTTALLSTLLHVMSRDDDGDSQRIEMMVV